MLLIKERLSPSLAYNIKLLTFRLKIDLLLIAEKRPCKYIILLAKANIRGIYLLEEKFKELLLAIIS
jgi:hypothetical protein